MNPLHINTTVWVRLREEYVVKIDDTYFRNVFNYDTNTFHAHDDDYAEFHVYDIHNVLPVYRLNKNIISDPDEYLWIDGVFELSLKYLPMHPPMKHMT